MPHTTVPGSVAASLKQETQELHTKTEQLIAPRLMSIRDYQDYAGLLHLFYGFFHPLEKLVAGHLSPSTLPDIAERRNSELILKDLQSIHSTISGLPLAAELPPVRSEAEALGALYVMEGSTLGGRMIMKMLMKNPALPLREDQLNFFAGYGADTGKKWTGFQEVLNRHTQQSEAIIASANHTFKAFAHWITQTLNQDESKN